MNCPDKSPVMLFLFLFSFHASLGKLTTPSDDGVDFTSVASRERLLLGRFTRNLIESKCLSGTRQSEEFARDVLIF